MDFIHGDLPESDIQLFGLDSPKKLHAKTWQDLAVECGVFQSKGQAKKNGWQGEIPSGFSQRTAGKKGVITVLNWFE